MNLIFCAKNGSKWVKARVFGQSEGGAGSESDNGRTSADRWCGAVAVRSCVSECGDRCGGILPAPEKRVRRQAVLRGGI